MIRPSIRVLARPISFILSLSIKARSSKASGVPIDSMVMGPRSLKSDFLIPGSIAHPSFSVKYPEYARTCAEEKGVTRARSAIRRRKRVETARVTPRERGTAGPRFAVCTRGPPPLLILTLARGSFFGDGGWWRERVAQGGGGQGWNASQTPRRRSLDTARRTTLDTTPRPVL